MHIGVGDGVGTSVGVGLGPDGDGDPDGAVADGEGEGDAVGEAVGTTVPRGMPLTAPDLIGKAAEPETATGPVTLEMSGVIGSNSQVIVTEAGEPMPVPLGNDGVGAAEGTTQSMSSHSACTSVWYCPVVLEKSPVGFWAA
jgi:hypothetical protein